MKLNSKKLISILAIIAAILAVLVVWSTFLKPKEYLRVINIEPILSEVEGQRIKTALPVVVVFSEPIKSETINYTIEPYLQASAKTDETNTKVSIEPTSGFWPIDKEFKIILGQSIQSVNGHTLFADYPFTFQTEKPVVGE